MADGKVGQRADSMAVWRAVLKVHLMVEWRVD